VSAAIVPAAVIVCTRDRPTLLEDALSSIAGGDAIPIEIVVVDQSSRPNEPLARSSLIGTCRLVYVRDEGRGLGRARNIGAANTALDLLVYCDDDVLVEPSWLASLTAPLLRGDGEAATGRVVAGAPEQRGAFGPAVVLDEHPAVYDAPVDRDVLAGGNSALSRSVLEVVGGWDDRLGAGSRFPAAEDNDLGLRLLERGYRIVYVPDAVLHHRSWRPGGRYPLVRWRYGLGKGGFYAKHARLPALRRRALRDVARRGPSAASAAARRPIFALGELLYAAGVLVGGARWFVTMLRHPG